MEFWDVKRKSLISNPRAPDSTQYAWAPDGLHLMTATTSPRLRVGNGYKVWHYDGTCIYQVWGESGCGYFGVVLWVLGVFL